jgi:chromosome partitioning protein
MDQSLEAFYTLDEVANVLKVSTRTITRLCDKGELKKVRISENAVRIPSSSLKEYMNKFSQTESLGNVYDEVKKLKEHSYVNLKAFQKEGPVCISVVNHKGGVGKSEFVKEIAAYFALNGFKVLMVDNDPQGNLSSDFDKYPISEGGEILPQACFIYDKNPLPLQQVVTQTSIPNLDIIPNSVIISSKEYEIMSIMYREEWLKKYFKRPENIITYNSYDYVIIDNPPSGGIFVINALIASQFYLIPVQATRKSLEGTFSFQNIINQIQDVSDIIEIGKVLNDWEAKRNEPKEIAAELEKRMGGYIFKSKIRHLSDISAIREPKVSLNGNSEAKKDMLAFCKELEARLNSLYKQK